MQKATWLIFSFVITASCLAQDFTYTGSDFGDWNDSTNWSPVGVPGSGDNVSISGHQVQVGQAIAINALTMNSATLLMYNSATAEIQSTADLTDSQISGSGTLTVDASAVLTSNVATSAGNTLSCSVLNLGALNSLSGVLTLNNTTNIGMLTSEAGADISIQYGTLFNSGTLAGTLNVTNGMLEQDADSHCTGVLNISGSMYGYGNLQLDGTINASGSAGLGAPITISSSGTLNFLPYSNAYVQANVSCNGAINLTDCSVQGAYWNSSITIQPSGTLTSTVVSNSQNYIYENLNNFGVVNAADGILVVNNFCNEMGGTLASASGASISVDANTLYNSGTIAGTLNVDGGVLEQDADSHCTGTLNISSGMTGYGTLLLDGTANVSGFAWLGASITISSSGTLNFLPYSNANVQADVSCNGAINVTDCSVQGYWFTGITIQPSGTLTSAALSYFPNYLDTLVYNFGVVNATDGVLVVNNFYNETSGSLASAPGASISVDANTLYNSGTIAGTLNVDGGTLEQDADSHCTVILNISSAMTGYGALLLDGTANVSGFAWLGAPINISSSGILNFRPSSNAYVQANVSCSGAINVTDCSVQGSYWNSSITIQPSGTLTSALVPNSQNHFNALIYNFGVANAASGTLVVNNFWNEMGGTLTSAPGGDISVASGTLYNSGTIAGTLNVNGGTLEQDADSHCTGVLNIFSSITGSGTLLLDGTANVSSFAWLGAPISVSSSGTLNFLPYSNAYVQANVSCSGAINLTDCSVQGSYWNSSITIQSSGTLTSTVVSTSQNYIYENLNNFGVVNTASGSLVLTANITNQAGGVLTSLPGAAVDIPWNTVLFNSGTISGTMDLEGDLEQQADSHFPGVLNISGSTNGYGAILLDGTVNVIGYASLATPLTVDSGGVLNFNSNSAQLWGHIQNNNGGTLKFLPDSNTQLWGDIYNSGTLSASSCTVQGSWLGSVYNLDQGTFLADDCTIGAMVLNYGTASLNGNVTFTGSYLQQSGATSINDASVNKLTMNDGLLTGSGSIWWATIDGGAVQPLGLLSTSIYQQSGGTLQFNIAGPSPIGRLQVDLEGSISGALNVAFTDGYVPGPNDRFEIATLSNSVSEQLTINLPAGEQVVYGPSSIVSGDSSIAVAGLPVLQSISPSSGFAFSTSQITMTASGTGLAPGSTIVLAGTALNTTFVNSTQLQASFDCSALSVGSYAVAVVGPAPQYNVSNALQFTVQQAFAGPFWSNPTAITYGTPLGAQQLNATATVPGNIVYSPAAGTILQAGSQTLEATFTPVDTVNYQTANVFVSITVNQATPTITWNNPANIVYGTALGSTQLNATSNVSGSFSYSPASGIILAAGTQTLTAIFTPTDTTDYQTVTTSVSIAVDKAAPVVTWANPADIIYSTALGGTQLNATASVPGSFSYSPPSGTVLTAGAHTLSATFTPTDSADYLTASASTSITVDKDTPVITWTNPDNIVYGTALSAAQLNPTASVPGSFSYSPSFGTVLAAGSQTLSATFTPTDSANYQSVSVSASITVDKATPAITWDNPASIVYGTALGLTQLDAMADVPGSFSYSPSSGTVLAAGSYLLGTVFTPTDTTNYQTTSASAQIIVNKATPVITWANPADIVNGTPLSTTQLNASANVPGTFNYTPAASTVLGRGNAQSLSVGFTPTDAVDYTTASASVLINVLNAPPTITSAAIASPNPIRYGSTTTLSASASDLEQDTLTYTWNFGDGTPTEIGASLPHVYSTPGTYNAVVTITDGNGGSVSSSVSVVVNPNAAPTVATAASATPNPVSGTSTALSVLGADDTGEAGLTYTWVATGTPPAAVLFSSNGTNQAKNTQANFSKAGQYTLQVTITDSNGATATSSVVVTVNQTFTTLAVAPATTSVYINETQQFSGTAYDQFGIALTAQPSITWSANGGGAISTAGLFTAANATGGPFTVTATSGSHSGTATLNVTVDAGLNAEFFDYTTALSVVPDFTGKTADVTRIDAQVNYAQTSSPWTGLDSRFASTFATRHHGYLKIDTAGTYTLYIKSSDGSNVYLDGVQIINNDGIHTLKEKSVQKTLTAGYHALRIEYFDNTNQHGLIFSWQGPSISKNVVPASQLFHGH